ncbi:amidase family protein [Acuticoccus yangtzensis]|uniref:amidase family protein n=1 Tax=Acuticoccus yangtzensis TaxID=1443441 RepID=UPI0009499B5A|nr:amidase family protein [Acuticoccus yangtzensis]
MGGDPRLMDLPAAILIERIGAGAMRAADLAAAAAARGEAAASAAKAPGAAQGTGLTWFDAEYLRRQGMAMDAWRGRGRPLGALHGLPVAVSDLVDTARIPTTQGFAGDSARVPDEDAALFARLRTAGAVLTGKAETAPFGLPGPAATTAGAARPLAARAAAAAVAVDTLGEVLGEAALGHVVGYRPSAGSVPMRGTFVAAPSLAAPVVLAGDLIGAAAVADTLFAADAGADFTMPSPPPGLKDGAMAAPLVAPTLAFVPPAWWDEADAAVKDAFAELQDVLAPRTFAAPLPGVFGEAVPQAQRILAAETARALNGTAAKFGDALPGHVSDLVAEGDAVLARDYLTALDWRTVLNAGLSSIFARCDAIIAPISANAGSASPREAGLAFAFLGLPQITLPLLADAQGRAIGALLVGPKGEDRRLFTTAAWLQATLLGHGQEGRNAHA